MVLSHINLYIRLNTSRKLQSTDHGKQSSGSGFLIVVAINLRRPLAAPDISLILEIFLEENIDHPTFAENV